MKKGVFIRMFIMLVIAAIAASACNIKTVDPGNYKLSSNTYEYIPYEELSVDYSLADAKSDGCVVFENLQLTSGDEVWNNFIERTKTGNKGMVRLAHYYTLDSRNVSVEYYEREKDNYPVLYIQDLSFDGEAYRLYYKDGRRVYEYEYPYLVKFTGKPSSSTAIYRQYVRYFLVRDKDITFGKIEHSWYSSQSGDWVDCVQVYTDLIR